MLARKPWSGSEIGNKVGSQSVSAKTGEARAHTAFVVVHCNRRGLSRNLASAARILLELFRLLCGILARSHSMPVAAHKEHQGTRHRLDKGEFTQGPNQR